MNWTDIVGLATSIVTAIGGIVAARQLTLSKRQTRTQFEDANEQVFLRQKGRLSFDTWENWVDGIKSNLTLPAFTKAWEEIKSKMPHRFQELRMLEERHFSDDPKNGAKMDLVQLGRDRRSI